MEFPLDVDHAVRSVHYILVDDQPVPEPDYMNWMMWMTTANLNVADDMVGETRIDTSFLGINHNFGGEGLPLLWETMVFTGKMDGYTYRYASSEEAQEGHEKIVLMVIEADGAYIEL